MYSLYDLIKKTFIKKIFLFTKKLCFFFFLIILDPSNNSVPSYRRINLREQCKSSCCCGTEQDQAQDQEGPGFSPGLSQADKQEL